MTLTLWQKALVLIGVPLLFEYTFVIGLLSALENSARTTSNEREERRVLGTVLNLGEGVISCGKALALYLMADSEEALASYEKNLSHTREELSRLSRLLKTRRYSNDKIQSLSDRSRLCMSYLRETKRLCDIGDRNAALEYLKRMRYLAPLLESDLDDLTITIRRKNTEIDDQKTLQFTKIALLLGLTGSTLIALGLVAFFHRGTSGRLSVLIENTRKMEKGERLNPLMDGKDEISELDSVFHRMADSVNEATGKLRRSESQIRTIIENLPVGVITCHEDGTISSLNPRASRMFVPEGQNLIGAKFVTLIKSGNAATPEFFQNEVIGRCLEQSKEFKSRNAAGTDLPVEISASNLVTLDERGFLIQVADLTERYKIERTKQEFIAMVSHDLRTPLTSVRLSLQLMLSGGYGDFSEELHAKLVQGEHTLSNMIRLINDLLDVQKQQSGKFDIEMEVCDLLELFEMSTNSVESLGQKHNVRIRIQPINIDVLADPSRIVQVIVNLLANAIKFSPQDSTVTIRAVLLPPSATDEEDQPDAGSQPLFVEVQVRDEGCGIPADKLNIVFERFEQLDQANTMKAAGTGLGLAICKSIVEEHGGLIGVRSTLGAGSTFWFRLQVAPDWL